jgi:60S ribosomal subunit assembly/export protein LOC1
LFCPNPPGNSRLATHSISILSISTNTMAPIKSSKGAPSKGGASKGGASKGGKSASKSGDRPRPKKPTGPKPKTVEQKSKSTSHGPAKKKKRVYTEKELNIPTLNAIRPAGIQKPNGVKKGKTFVDDKESLMTILAMVQAEKEGNIESKMIRARQMEEIREARKAEADKREAGRKEKLVRTSHTSNTQTPSAHNTTGGSQG